MRKLLSLLPSPCKCLYEFQLSRSKTADSVNQKKHSNVKINCSYTIPLPPHLLLQVLPPLHPLSLLCLRHCQMQCLGYCKYLHTANKIIKHQKIFNYELFRLYFISIFLNYMYSFNLLSLNYHIHVDIRSMMSAGSWNNQDKLPSIEILSQLPQVFKMQSKTYSIVQK